jgi:alpha-beta hydrolase superfamily lysophospholipase
MNTEPARLAVPAWDETPPLAPRGTVIVLPGRGEHPGVYERLGRRLSADAYRVRFADATDLGAATGQVAALVADGAPSPVVLLGSDTGAGRAVGIAAGDMVTVQGLILGGLLPPSSNLSGPLSWDRELQIRTSCPTHRARLSGDNAFVRGALATPADETDLADHLPRITVPALALHGDTDEVSPLAVARKAYASIPDVQVVAVSTGRHDAFNDIMHRSVAAMIILFLERLRNGGTPVLTGLGD